MPEGQSVHQSIDQIQINKTLNEGGLSGRSHRRARAKLNKSSVSSVRHSDHDSYVIRKAVKRLNADNPEDTQDSKKTKKLVKGGQDLSATREERKKLRKNKDSAISLLRAQNITSNP